MVPGRAWQRGRYVTEQIFCHDFKAIDPAIRRGSGGARERARRGLYLAAIDRVGVPAPWVPGARAGEPGDRR